MKTDRLGGRMKDLASDTGGTQPKFKITPVAHAVAMALTPLLCAAPIVVEAQEMEEIVVTSTRRAVSVQDVPHNISAVTGDTLEDQGITDIDGLVKVIPGINFVDKGPRSGLINSGINIRGLSADTSARTTGVPTVAATVATYVNDTPMFANIRLQDIERVEVLRGPQGTLYGSGSLGGTIRFIQNKPDFDGISGQMQVGTGSTSGADDLNYEVSGVINIPISDSAALRANVGYVTEAGYIDYENLLQLDSNGLPVLADPTDVLGTAYLFTRQEDVNDTETLNARVALRWEPSDTAEINLAFHHQSDEADGGQRTSPDQPGQSEDSLSNRLLKIDTYEGETNMLAADVNIDVGFATLTSSTSWYETDNEGTNDQTGLYESFFFYEHVYGRSPRPFFIDTSAAEETAFIQEFRLTSNSDGAVDWIVGAFYMEQETDIRNEQFGPGYQDYTDVCIPFAIANGLESIPGAGINDPGDIFDETSPCGLATLLGVPPQFGGFDIGDDLGGGVIAQRDFSYLANSQNDFTDLAIFGEVTWHVSDAWQMTGGFRAFDQKYETNQQGGLVYANTISVRSAEFEENDVLFKFNTSFYLNDSHMMYATWSEGFRRGGANALPLVVFGAPTNPGLFLYDSDRVENREIGFKGTFGDTINYTIAAFDVEWEDIQVPTIVTPLALIGVANVGDASSTGFELELIGYLTENLLFNFGFTNVKAELDTPSALAVAEFGAANTVAGHSLPGSPENTASLLLQYNQELASGKSVLYSLSGAYRDDSNSELQVGINRPVDGFATWDIGVTLESEDWALRGFVKNVGDDRGLYASNAVSQWGQSATAFVTAPRTVGATLTYYFD